MTLLSITYRSGLFFACFIVIIDKKINQKESVMFSNTSNLFYEYTAHRIAHRRRYFKLSNKEIADREEKTEPYYDHVFGEFLPEEKIPKQSKYDPTMISRIVHNNRTNQNRYLIPRAYINLLVTKLSFKNESEMFWGNSWELDYIAPHVFRSLILDIKHQTDIDNVENLLIDYVPYARFLAFIETLHSTLEKLYIPKSKLQQFKLDVSILKKSELTAKHHKIIQEISFVLAIFQNSGVELTQFTNKSLTDPEIYSDILFQFENVLNEAIDRQYLHLKKLFRGKLEQFFKNTKSFKQLPKAIDIFCKEEFIPMLLIAYKEQHHGLEPSIENIGKRVYDIFRLDIEPLLLQTNINSLSDRNLILDNTLLPQKIIYPELISASFTYINHLITYQELMNQSKSIEFYSQFKWDTKYEQYLKNIFSKKEV